MAIDTQGIVQNFITGVHKQQRREDAEINNLKRVFDPHLRDIGTVIQALVKAINLEHFGNASYVPPKIYYDLHQKTAEAFFEVSLDSERKAIKVMIDGESITVAGDRFVLGDGSSPYPKVMAIMRDWFERRTVNETLA